MIDIFKVSILANFDFKNNHTTIQFLTGLKIQIFFAIKYLENVFKVSGGELKITSTKKETPFKVGSDQCFEITDTEDFNLEDYDNWVDLFLLKEGC